MSSMTATWCTSTSTSSYRGGYPHGATPRRSSGSLEEPFLLVPEDPGNLLPLLAATSQAESRLNKAHRTASADGGPHRVLTAQKDMLCYILSASAERPGGQTVIGNTVQSGTPP